jgi:predicted N-formylglutamate amidohydrolase
MINNKTHFKKVKKNNAIIFTCEHASSRIPKNLNNLGLIKKDLKNCKDLYDPYAKDLFLKLVETFNSSYIYSDLSRLVIDMNRNIGAKNKDLNTYHSALIKKQILVEERDKEFFVNIPHNQNIDFQTEEKIYNEICIPYQNDIKDIILKLQKDFGKVYIVSVHTMFPKYNGPLRPVEIDLIGDEDSSFFKKVIKDAKAENNKLKKKYNLNS